MPLWHIGLEKELAGLAEMANHMQPKLGGGTR